MVLWQLFDPESSTFTYLVGDAGEAAAIDPVRDRVDEVLAVLDAERLALRWVLETHVHADHVTGGGVLRERTGARLAIHHLANACACSDRSLADGDEVRVGAVTLRVLETPGHTPESVSYLVDGRMVMTGDALLVGTCGRTDFQHGDPGALYDAIHARLFTLPDDVIVYPGHDYKGQTSSTIGRERAGNARLTGRTRDEFIALMSHLNLPPPRRIAEALPANERCGEGGIPHAS